MNERTRYEQSLADQLNNLQLPDEDKAWLAMKKLLDEKDDDGAVILPPPRSGCGLWGVALLLLLVIGGLIIYFTKQDHPGKDFPQKVSENRELNKNNDSENSLTSDSAEMISSAGVVVVDSINPGSDLDQVDNVAGTSGKISVSNEKGSSATLSNQINTTRIKPGSNKKISSVDKGRSAIAMTSPRREEESGNDNRKKNPGNTDAARNVNITPGKTDDTNQPLENKNIPVNPSIEVDTDSIPVSLEIEPDTTSKEIDSLKKEIEKSDSSQVSLDSMPGKKKGFSFAVGIAGQHTFPINGTESVSNGLLGRKSNLADYIPSLYLRLYRENRWFVQTEFKYGAPQYVKGFAYRTIDVVDSFQEFRTRTFFLKKTFYHQVPLSFHYYVLPGWSVGTGVVYNRFQGTISEEELRLRIPGTTIDTVLESKIIDHKQDSSFNKNTWQWMVETQYKWKRFSFGARYAQGLQPYIEYRDPQGLPQSKKHHSFNIFLRYELWRSKQK